MVSMEPKSPSFNVDRVAWNRAWEQELAGFYGSRDMPSYTGPSLIGTPPMWDILAASDASVQLTNNMVEETAILQRNLSQKAVFRFAKDDFESKWKSCTSETREKWILEGLVRTCQASPHFEERRMLCPEVTLPRLNLKGNGQPFLDLLQALCLEDIYTVPANPKPLPSDAFNRFNGHDVSTQDRGCQLYQLTTLTKRTYFLVMFVWNVLLAFHGESRTVFLRKLAPASKSKPSMQQVVKLLGLKNKDVKRYVSCKGAEPACQNCRLFADQIEGLTALVACSRCKSIGRHVYYCGRSCQVNDYKNGNPPHKQICGNTDALLDATLSSPESKPKAKTPHTSTDEDQSEDIPRWPAPQPGYTRSPALQYQLLLLDEHPNLDYVLVRPEPQPDTTVVFPNAIGHFFFGLCMRRAVACYSPMEVYHMYQALEPSARKAMPAFGVEKLKEQLKKEYGVDIDEVHARIQAVLG
ncbi:hypothetical protein BT96DRAFT_996949 [Gymnopus androsaceus JB14]|uniref:MYND-type domain-containing protein n=1 Tax=Gymnopus androsaceus JB14 TaxID=1447944 RepID=A0A6A4HGI6_9AGAR|nr:hypothetical protein BT96DRAFT_996949 [Gymnopus androsaceus JB14]